MIVPRSHGKYEDEAFDVSAGKKITPTKIRQEPNENESRRKAYEGRRRQRRLLIYKRESETEAKNKKTEGF
jgi:hypothetical protein